LYLAKFPALRAGPLHYPATQPPALRLPGVEVGGGKVRAYVPIRPKDSNAAVGVSDRATQKAPEGYGRQKQTNKLSAHYTPCLNKNVSLLFSE